MAPVSSPRYRDRDELTRGGIVNVISYWPASQRTHWYDARICLGEIRTDTLNRFDLCYSFKMLCWAEYGGTHQLHLTAKNYVHNYSLCARLHQNRRVPYERALRNLTVLMFSHYVHQLESCGSFEGHRTLMVHECLQVATTLGRYHWWQHRMSLQEKSENADWNKVPAVPKYDFRRRYSPTLTLLGSTQNPAFTHPKLLLWQRLPQWAVDRWSASKRETTHWGPVKENLYSRIPRGGHPDWKSPRPDGGEPIILHGSHLPCQSGHSTSPLAVPGVLRTPGNFTWP